MLQYTLLHLFGYAVTMDDLKNFRVWLGSAAISSCYPITRMGNSEY